MSPVCRQRPFVARAAFVTLAALALAACTSKREGPGQLPGALAKPLDQYTGTELRELTESLPWTGGHERQRRCRGDTACTGATPGKTTLVRIDAVGGEDSIVIRQVPQNGVIAAQLVNRGALEEGEYHLKPGGRYSYYLVVYAGDSTGSWRVEELDHDGGTYTHREIGRGTFRSCDHPFVRGARADFKSCANAAGSGQMKLMLQGSDPTLTDPIWVSCSGGCCIASAS